MASNGPTDRPRVSRRTMVLKRVDRDSLFIAALSLTWLALLVDIPARLNQDGWLALVAGRDISQHGIPQHDRLTALTHGVRWIDQQWLSQLLIYELHQLGGLALYCIVYVGLGMLALGMAIAAARRLGGADLHIAAVLLVPTFVFVAASAQVRTQGFAYPLFVAALWLLATEARRPTRRAYLLMPLLVVWANLHGSVTLGVGLGVLYGVSLLVRCGSSEQDGRPWRRALVFIVASPLCLLVTPYGIDTIGYYHDTLGNRAFGELITEWRPVTSIPFLAVPYFGLAFGAVWLLGRSRRRPMPFDDLALLMTIAAGIAAVRNVTWLGLTAIVLLPGMIGTVVKAPAPQPRRLALNVGIAASSTLLLLVTIAVVAGKPASWFERGYDARATKVVARATQADPGLRVYGGDRFSDWLLWHQPELAGRVAYDSRLELLSDRQLRHLADFASDKSASGAIVSGFGLLVLDPRHQKAFTRRLLRAPGTRVLYRGHKVIVARRPQR